MPSTTWISQRPENKMKHTITELEFLQSRRAFLLNSGMGLGTAALASLFSKQDLAAKAKTSTKPKAKRIIFLFMAGAPSQVDLFDHKPDLHKLFKTELPKSISKGQRVTAMTRGKQQLVAPSTFKFSQQGKSGVWMSELLPHLRHRRTTCASFIPSIRMPSITTRVRPLFVQVRKHPANQAWGLG